MTDYITLIINEEVLKVLFIVTLILYGLFILYEFIDIITKDIRRQKEREFSTGE